MPTRDESLSQWQLRRRRWRHPLSGAIPKWVGMTCVRAAQERSTSSVMETWLCKATSAVMSRVRVDRASSLSTVTVRWRATADQRQDDGVGEMSADLM